MRICPKSSPEERVSDPKANQEVEASEQRDYYNVVPRKTPSAGGIKDLVITSVENKQDPDIFGVRVTLTLDIYLASGRPEKNQNNKFNFSPKLSNASPAQYIEVFCCHENVHHFLVKELDS